ncbi:MAG: potassium channel protein [Spirochaetes bacterium]|nr:potassium channel protein [Spirochaetota bacterium]
MPYKNVRNAAIMLCCVLLFGTLSYHFIEGMTLFESFYMTIITISTVGFSEIRPLSTIGRVITIIIISTGIIIGAYTIGTLLRLFIEGEISRTLGRRKVEKQIASLKDHYIICGYGRIGKLICQELAAAKVPFVVIENDPQAIEQLQKEKYLFLAFDATQEDALKSAGIMHAKGIVTALRSDADNVFITLTARGLRNDIYILARASEESSIIKLKRAGATRVDLPYTIGAKRMAQALIRPAVGDFIDLAIMDMDRELGLGMEEVIIRENSTLVGKNLIESNIRKDYGVIIVAIKRKNGLMEFNPASSTVLHAHDVLVVMGKKEDLLRMNRELTA